MFYSQGDILEVSFDPSLGHEPRSRRPALVISDNEFNRMSSLVFLAPITSTLSGYPLHIELPYDCDVHGAICIEQSRSLDLDARKHQKVCSLDEETMSKVLESIGAVFGL